MEFPRFTALFQEIFQTLWKTGQYQANKNYPRLSHSEKEILLFGNFKFGNDGDLVGIGTVVSGSKNVETVYQGEWKEKLIKLDKIIWPWGHYDCFKKILELETGATFEVQRVTFSPDINIIVLQSTFQIIIQKRNENFDFSCSLPAKSFNFTIVCGQKLKVLGSDYPTTLAHGFLNSPNQSCIFFQVDLEKTIFTLACGNTIIIPSVCITIDTEREILMRIYQLNLGKTDNVDVQLEKPISIPKDFVRPPPSKQLFLTFSQKQPEKRPVEGESTTSVKKTRTETTQDGKTETAK